MPVTEQDRSGNRRGGGNGAYATTRQLVTQDSSARSYRHIDAEGTSTPTAPVLTALAGAALAVLAREGEPDGAGWRHRSETGDGQAFDIRCEGPDLPSAIPAETVVSSEIPKDPKWRGTHRLTVAPPLIALDLCWNPGEPLRIMTFSRGDWEDALLALAGGGPA